MGLRNRPLEGVKSAFLTIICYLLKYFEGGFKIGEAAEKGGSDWTRTQNTTTRVSEAKKPFH